MNADIYNKANEISDQILEYVKDNLEKEDIELKDIQASMLFLRTIQTNMSILNEAFLRKLGYNEIKIERFKNLGITC